MVIKVKDKVEVILEHPKCLPKGCYNCRITKGRQYKIVRTDWGSEGFGDYIIENNAGMRCAFPIECLKKIPDKMDILKRKLMGDKNGT